MIGLNISPATTDMERQKTVQLIRNASIEERQGHQGISEEMDMAKEREDICCFVTSDTEFRIRRKYWKLPQDMKHCLI